MNDPHVNQWLSEHDITLESSFVSALKAHAAAFKKRLACVFLKYIAGLDVQNTI